MDMANKNNLLLEPLSKATQTALQPLTLAPDDKLCVQLDKEGRSFVCRAVRAEAVADEVAAEAQAAGKRITRDERGTYHVLHGAASWHAREFFYRLTEARVMPRGMDWSPWDTWLVAATDYNAIMLRSCWPEDRLVYDSDNTRLLLEYLLKRFQLQAARARLQAEFKLEGKVPAPPPGFVDHATLPLADYQQAALSFCAGQESTALFMDRGTGKTAVSIARVCWEGKRARELDDRMTRVLVVCPNKARINWQSETERFATVSGKVTVLRGGKIKRIKLLTQAIESEDDCAFSMVIIGYETFVNDHEHLSRVPWDLVITDESHYFKSSATNRFAALQALRDSCRARMELTGTPMANSIVDLWSQLEFLGEGLSGFTTKTAFKDFHLRYENGVEDAAGNSIKRLVGLKNVPLLQERLARLTFTITKDEAGLKLPEKVYDMYEAEMASEQVEVYEQIAVSLAAEIEEELAGSNNLYVTAEHILTKLLRLAQVTSGFVKVDATETEAAKIVRVCKPNPKVEAVVEMLQDPERDPLGKTVIWCCWVEDVKAISERLTELSIVHGTLWGGVPERQRDEFVRRFNNDDSLRVLIANPKVGGDSINLLGYNPDKPEASQMYCDHEVFFSQNWSYIERAQAEDRAHRRGTRKQVRITDLVIPGTIDEEIRKRVWQKQDVAKLVQDIRLILQAVLGNRE